MKLRNKTRSSSKVGFLVKAVRGGFEYAGLGDTPIGVVTEVVSSGAQCEIQTSGDAKVYVGRNVSEGDSLRLTVQGEGGIAGVSYPIGTASAYTAVGSVVKSGRGLVSVALNLASAGVVSGEVSGLPSGGATGYVLTKLSAADGDADWQVASSSGISDAPSDSVAYSRYNAGWVDANLRLDSSGGSGTVVNTVAYGDRITFVGDGTYISTSYSYALNVHQIGISLTPGALDTRWDLMTADGTVPTARPYTTAQIGNTANVAFLEGVYTTISYALNNVFGDYSPTLTEPANEITIEVDHNQMNADGIFYSQSEVDTLLSAYASQSWVSSNFDNYVGWNYEYDTVTPQSVAIGAGSSFGLVPGTDIGFSWDGVNRRQTINYTGSPSYTGWNFEVLGVAHNIGNGGTAELIAGTGIVIAYTLGTGGEHQAKITNSLPPPWTTDTNGITYTAGNVGIGIASHSSFALRVSGTALIDGGITLDHHTLQDSIDRPGLLDIIGDGVGYNGIQIPCDIDAKWSVMGQQGNFGLYDDTNADWILNYSENAGVSLYYNGNTKLKTNTSGIEVTGTTQAGTDVITIVSSNSNYPSLSVSNTSTGTNAASRISCNSVGNNLSLACFADLNAVYGSNHSRLYSTAGGANIGIGSSTELGFLWTVNADVKLYYNNVAKFATTTSGISVTGGVYATGEVESYDTSDINLKDKIERLDVNYIAKEMLSSSLISYNHKVKGKREIGWIAQEIEMFLPENVKYDDDGNLMIHYGKMAVALGAVDRYQQDQIEELRAEIEALKRKLERY